MIASAGVGFSKKQIFRAGAGKKPVLFCIFLRILLIHKSSVFLNLNSHERFFESWKQGEQYMDPKTFAPLISGSVLEKLPACSG
jgi:hypothetical protein